MFSDMSKSAPFQLNLRKDIVEEVRRRARELLGEKDDYVV